METRREHAIPVLDFIDMVQRRPCLWKHSLKSYGTMDATNDAWNEIAAETGDSEKNCRYRWKNIRTAYGRSLRVMKTGKGRQGKKPYYLADALSFLTPYLKGKDLASENPKDHSVEESSSTDNDDSHLEFVSVNKTFDEPIIKFIEKAPPPKNPINVRNEARTASHERTSFNRESKENERNADELFFRSLLPDFNKLTNKRKRSFKMQTMSLLHDMLDQDENDISGSASPSQSTSMWTFQQDVTTAQANNDVENNMDSSAWHSNTQIKDEQTSDRYQ